jgi:phosphoribosyl 1,2-cyclic phosphodiesterase
MRLIMLGTGNVRQVPLYNCNCVDFDSARLSGAGLASRLSVERSVG